MSPKGCSNLAGLALMLCEDGGHVAGVAVLAQDTDLVAEPRSALAGDGSACSMAEGPSSHGERDLFLSAPSRWRDTRKHLTNLNGPADTEFESEWPRPPEGNGSAPVVGDVSGARAAASQLIGVAPPVPSSLLSPSIPPTARDRPAGIAPADSEPALEDLEAELRRRRVAAARAAAAAAAAQVDEAEASLRLAARRAEIARIASAEAEAEAEREERGDKVATR